MELPQDIEQRIERRWFARYVQDANARRNETPRQYRIVDEKPTAKHYVIRKVGRPRSENAETLAGPGFVNHPSALARQGNYVLGVLRLKT